MAPNLKAIERLDDVEAKLVETEKEAEKARKDSKNARDQFNDIRKQRHLFPSPPVISLTDIRQ